MTNLTQLGPKRSGGASPGIMDMPVSPTSDGATTHRPEATPSLPQTQVGDSVPGSVASRGESCLMRHLEGMLLFCIFTIVIVCPGLEFSSFPAL
ncbi:hypothetical protein NDU88_008246 [Pleurodeles waltl]|uniref:Uncharacterized protein n=1 Tax=Pleurodeles waltl TaxID=8319 RepID=A0AAV7RV87_PLEWA|nr:hypothetical protein NDU88_008246 [Pleurodeles waltl]